jgi:hypothetical protein
MERAALAIANVSQYYRRTAGLTYS